MGGDCNVASLENRKEAGGPRVRSNRVKNWFYWYTYARWFVFDWFLLVVLIHLRVFRRFGTFDCDFVWFCETDVCFPLCFHMYPSFCVTGVGVRVGAASLYLYLYIFIFLYLFIYIYIYLYLYLYLYIYIFIYLYLYLSLYLYIYIYNYIYIYIYTYIYMHIYIYIYIYIYIFIYSYLYPFSYSYSYSHSYIHRSWHFQAVPGRPEHRARPRRPG